MTGFKRVKADHGSIVMRKPVYGFGKNDADYKVYITIDGKMHTCPYYLKWIGILQRCYDKSFHDRQPTYKGCAVCDEWLAFTNFRRWMASQSWKGKELDKDLLVPGNKIYSPVTCCFVSSRINSILTYNRNKKSGLPQGVRVCESSGKYLVKSTSGGVSTSLGSFLTVGSANIAYRNLKAKQIRDIAKGEKKKVKDALHRHAEILEATSEKITDETIYENATKGGKELSINEFCKAKNVTLAELARVCGTTKQNINNLQTRAKHPHVVRYDEKTGDVQIVKVEKIMCHGNLKRKR